MLTCATVTALIAEDWERPTNRWCFKAPKRAFAFDRCWAWDGKLLVCSLHLYNGCGTQTR